MEPQPELVCELPLAAGALTVGSGRLLQRFDERQFQRQLWLPAATQIEGRLIEQLDRAGQPIEFKALRLRVERGTLLGGEIDETPDRRV